LTALAAKHLTFWCSTFLQESSVSSSSVLVQSLSVRRIGAVPGRRSLYSSLDLMHSQLPRCRRRGEDNARRLGPKTLDETLDATVSNVLSMFSAPGCRSLYSSSDLMPSGSRAAGGDEQRGPAWAEMVDETLNATVFTVVSMFGSRPAGKWSGPHVQTGEMSGKGSRTCQRKRGKSWPSINTVCSTPVAAAC
jgi:hypothetical protein